MTTHEIKRLDGLCINPEEIPEGHSHNFHGFKWEVWRSGECIRTLRSHYRADAESTCLQLGIGCRYRYVPE